MCTLVVGREHGTVQKESRISYSVLYIFAVFCALCAFALDSISGTKYQRKDAKIAKEKPQRKIRFYYSYFTLENYLNFALQ
jgi:hypothetical protein